MSVEMNLEREFKFDVDAGFDPPDLRPVAGRTERLPSQYLTTTYFDTPDRRLWAQGITLRHRTETEGDTEPGQTRAGKWTLKLPEPVGSGTDGGTARSELSWPGGPADVPGDARATVAGLVRRARLEPVVVLSTERRRLLLHGPAAGKEPAAGNGPLAEMDDDIVTVTSGEREGLRFRQLEVEVLGEADGQEAVLEEVVGRLRQAGAAPGGGSKFALAAGLDEYQPAARKKAPRPAGLADAVGAMLRRDLERLMAWDYRLRIPVRPADPADLDTEAVHQARVAIRRLRSDVKTLNPVLDPVWAKHAHSDLKWIGDLLGRLRDEDVLVERVRRDSDPADKDAVEEVVRMLRSDRHLGATELCEALASARYLDLVDRLAAAAGSPPLVGPTGERPDSDLDDTLRSVVAARWRAARAGADELTASSGDDELHHLRILSKRLRYAAEAAEPYLGKPAARAAADAKSLQTTLGVLTDAVNASRELRELASHPSVTPAVAFVAGRIAGQAEVEMTAARRKWRKAARRLGRPKTASWLS
jgi:CHAD domain-containing protein